MCGKGHVWQGGVHDRGHVWRGGACMAGETATAAYGTHPTEMRSCLMSYTQSNQSKFLFSTLFLVLPHVYEEDWQSRLSKAFKDAPC